jgi:hypothetical protein
MNDSTPPCYDLVTALTVRKLCEQLAKTRPDCDGPRRVYRMFRKLERRAYRGRRKHANASRRLCAAVAFVANRYHIGIYAERWW